MAGRVDGYLPLRDYALLGDGRTCAVIGLDGAVDWWPLPRMDDPPTFGALLDPDRGGRLVLRPVESYQASRCYLDGGGVVQTEFRTDSGTVRVTDALTADDSGLLPWCELARRIDAVEGAVPMCWDVEPGDRFGESAVWARMFGETPVITIDGLHLGLVLDGVGEPEQRPDGFGGTFTVRPEEPSLLAVVATHGEPCPVPDAADVLRRIQETAARWSRWTRRIRYEGRWRDAVVRSAVVHKQLSYLPTGGLQAAATTSLPERIGGSRNFDYRFSWVRDTGFALTALTSLGLRSEVHAAVSYLLRSVARTAPDVRVFYPIHDGVSQPDQIRPLHLWRGYRGSAPVKVGNSAGRQRQLGVYGDLIEAISRYARHGNVLDGGTGRLVSQIAEMVCRQWREDDSGLWELGESRQYTSSKIGCWSALTKAATLAENGQIPGGRVERWRSVADEIHAYVDTACWSEGKRSYTFYAGTSDLDCACLLAARTGFCAGDDPRLGGTIDAIRRELSAGGPLLYRYSGMAEEEGAFVACSFWLVEALCASGRIEEARQTMDSMVDLANDVGLYSEEMDPDSHEMLGNMPQLLSHLALIGAATAYARATRDR